MGDDMIANNEIDINVIQTNSNCFISAVETIAEYHKRNVGFVGAMQWQFKLNITQSKLVANQIYEDELYEDLFIGLKKYAGIDFNAVNEYGVNYVFDRIDAGFPVLVHFNTFYCPWSMDYEKHEYDHYFVICGYDKREQMFICIDSYLEVDRYMISESVLQSGFINFLDYKLTEFKEITSDEFVSELMKNIDEGEIFRRIKKIGDIIEKKLNYEIEFLNYENDFNAIPLIIKIENLSRDRLNISAALTSVNFIDNNKERVKECFETSSREWHYVSLLLLKYKIVKDEKLLSVIRNRLYKISQIEKNAYQIILEIIKYRKHL